MVGTRPEIVKMSPVIRECEKRGIDYFILHTGQHYSYEMDGVFFEQLKLRKPDYNLAVGSGTHAEMTGKMMIEIEKILIKEQVDVVLVEGDTDSVLAAALATVKLRIPVKVGHVEAGLRSYDRRMPEEINRVLVDHCSDYLFAPTPKARQILINEGIPESKIFVTGNTIVDAIHQIPYEDRVKSYWEFTHQLQNGYILATVHRQENVDDRERFLSILTGLTKVAEYFGMRVIYPVHPRAKRMMAEFDLRRMLKPCVELIVPCDYRKFLWLEKHASLVLTDSGGVQEECCILGVPCVTLRDNTERPETIEVGANVLAGTSPDKIVECAKIMLGKKAIWANPFGDGFAAERIIKVLRRQLDE